jgi:hypothetical protein
MSVRSRGVGGSGHGSCLEPYGVPSGGARFIYDLSCHQFSPPNPHIYQQLAIYERAV